MPAYGPPCDLGEDGHPANWLLTQLEPSATFTVCNEDLPLALIPMLAANLGVPGDRLYDVIKRFVDREAAKEAKAAKDEPEQPAGDVSRETVPPGDTGDDAA